MVPVKYVFYITETEAVILTTDGKANDEIINFIKMTTFVLIQWYALCTMVYLCYKESHRIQWGI